MLWEILMPPSNGNAILLVRVPHSCTFSPCISANCPPFLWTPTWSCPWVVTLKHCTHDSAMVLGTIFSPPAPVWELLGMLCHQKNAVACTRPFTLGGIASAMVLNFSFLVHIKTFMAVTLGCNPCPLLVSCTLLLSLSQMKAINFHFLVCCERKQMLECISRQHTLANSSQGLNAWRNQSYSKSWGST